MQRRAITLPQFALTVTVAVFLFPSLTKLTDALSDYHEAVAAAGRLFELTDRAKPLGTSGDSKPVPANPAALQFAGVVFQYSDNRDPHTGNVVLNDLSFTLNAGEQVGLVGVSGSGKSTILQLLLRFRAPDKGRILLDGTDISTMDPHALRGRIAVVPQEIHIFNDTLRENLRIASPRASDEKLQEAFRQADLWEFVGSLRQGLDTEIGERGQKLSGGQRQRLGLARALLKEAPVLALDEPTSNLDRASEQTVLESIRAVGARKIVLIISHRLSTVRNADAILVLKEGRITETGRHKELLVREGEYTRLFRRQADELALQS